MDEERWVWIDRYEARVIEEMHGGGWPRVMVEHWQENLLGERRLVDTAFYSPPTVAGQLRPAPSSEKTSPR